MLNRRKERKNPKPLAENELLIKVKNKTLRNMMLKTPIKLKTKNLFLIKFIFKEQPFGVLK